MLKAQISSWILQAVRYKLHPDQATIIMDAAQRMAFDNNSQSFLVWSETLTPYYVLTFASAGYTDAVAGDIGKTVVQGSNTGTLISYDNTAKEWVISTSDDFDDAGTVTITTGTGAGTLAATDAFAGYVGPYDAPTDPPCRKIWGITTETDARIFGASEDIVDFPMEDFDFQPRLFNPKSFFKPGREDNVGKTFTFAQAPSLPSSGVVYRWVYWRDAPTISTDDEADDETKILIPASYHMNFINACIKLAQLNLAGEDVDPNSIKAFFKPWWDTLSRPYTPMGKRTNQTLDPRGSADSLI